MRRLQLSRRAVLRGAGSVAIALPWLEAMEPLKSSRAAEVPARRFVAVYTPGGTVLENWSVPVGPLATLSPILAPLKAVADKLTVVQGLSMKCAVGEQQQAGMIGLLTGCSQERNGQEVPNASLDVELAARLDPPALYQAVRWATGAADGGQASVSNTVSYQRDGTTAFVLNQPAIDPRATWERLFGALPPNVDPVWKKSILDSVLGRYNKLAQQLGKADRQRLEHHAELLRSIEQGIQPGCRAPARADTAGYDPSAGPAQDPTTDAAIPQVGKLMMDMLVAALSCNLTNVGTLQWADSRAAYTLPWLDLPGNQVQNYYEGNGGFDAASMTKIFTWYSTQHAYLLQQMASIDLGGHSLLDESVVFFGSQLQSPATHVKSDMPFLLAGGGGGLQGGRALSYPGYSHNDLLLSILRLFGDERVTFGDASFCSGVLEGL